MFSKNTYLNVPSLHPRSSSLVDINGVEILLHHHHPDMFATHLNASQLGDPSSSSMANAPLPRKQAVKKDRHSKIYTAQGPRDRRVRLSIGIARKFFDLQEMLGFDKPSKTLDWLLTKSKEAIKDLVHSKKKATDNITDKSSSECELLSSTVNCEASENGADSKSKFGGKDPPQLAASNLAKESRAKARAKARARTREKMCIKQQLNGAKNSDLNVLQNRNNNQLEFFQLSAATTNNNINIGYPSLPGDDLIHESVSIRRKSKNPSFNLGFHQNVIVSSPNYVVPSADHASQNWDVCSFTSQSNNYTILDQHKFINWLCAFNLD